MSQFYVVGTLAKKIYVLFWTISFNPNRLRQRKECHKFQDKQLNGPESSLIRTFQQINKRGKFLVFYSKRRSNSWPWWRQGVSKRCCKIVPRAKDYYWEGTFKSCSTLFRENRRTLCEINASQFFQRIFFYFLDGIVCSRTDLWRRKSGSHTFAWVTGSSSQSRAHSHAHHKRCRDSALYDRTIDMIGYLRRSYSVSTNSIGHLAIK